MRIEVKNYTTIQAIDTTSLTVAAAWLHSMLREIISVGPSAPPWQISVWPSNETERSYIGNPAHQFFDADGLEAIADVFLEGSRRMRRRDNRLQAT